MLTAAAAGKTGATIKIKGGPRAALFLSAIQLTNTFCRLPSQLHSD